MRDGRRRQTGSLEIDFLAHDPDGHLATFSLVATYAENAGRRPLGRRLAGRLSPGISGLRRTDVRRGARSGRRGADMGGWHATG